MFQVACKIEREGVHHFDVLEYYDCLFAII